VDETPQLRSCRRALFAIFAVAILFSMMREWNTPIGCLRPLWEAHAHAAVAPPH